MSSNSSNVVLGGSGFIGTRLVSRLKELGLEVRIGDLNASLNFPGLYTHCDVRDASSMRDIFSGAGVIINLAAQHRDDVRPISRYHETNVEGARQVCLAAREAGIQTLIFTSSAAVYGFQPFPVDESGPFEPFNPYGETKLLAEGIYKTWAEEDPARSLVIVRPTVVFGEGNRGNVYNLLRQIASGRFMMVGNGLNKKSMAYVGNVAEFISFSLAFGPGIHTYNYVDAPDLDMNELVSLIGRTLRKQDRATLRLPYHLAYLGGLALDVAGRVLGRNFPISAVRIKKFSGNSQFSNDRALATGFTPPYSLEEALQRTVRAEFSPVGL